MVAVDNWKVLVSSGGDVFRSALYFTRFTSSPYVGLGFERTGSVSASRAFSSKVYQWASSSSAISYTGLRESLVDLRF